MEKKIGLTICNQRYDVTIEEDFALFLESKMANDFNVEGNNYIKKLLHAYVRANHELFQQDKKIKKITQDIDAKE